ncbi:hypothetical protein Phi17:1_gp15 [Cellulophaga phage phi17:1]|uniref:Uncharacterized protein n=1 Tax=Cellulophaga phage phi17:1 TaxID=1327980 RepID=R9ZYU2_9CAUD|nr:hypothetical protein Phi17:1_gp15 [Cellulophaga phage phi17:1]AGO48291.1 hypothetical protein Phi17:1_gp15 [Cellulophaga phage phi17:1]
MTNKMKSEMNKDAEANCPPNKRPIFYCNIVYTITTGKKKETFKALKCVTKGFKDEILKSNSAKLQAVKFIYKEDKAWKQKVYSFDLSRIEIRSFEVILFMGYGPKDK